MKREIMILRVEEQQDFKILCLPLEYPKIQKPRDYTIRINEKDTVREIKKADVSTSCQPSVYVNASTQTKQEEKVDNFSIILDQGRLMETKRLKLLAYRSMMLNS